MHISTILFLLTIAPVSLLLNDLFLQPLAVNSLLPVYVHYDDLFKTFWCMPVFGWIIVLVERYHGTVFKRDQLSLSFLLLSGFYFYGFGVNQTHNALDNYLKRRTEVVVPPEVEGGIYFFDEYVGHWLLAVSYAGLQARWLWIEVRGKRKAPKVEEPKGFVTALAVASGYFTALALLESQAMFFFVYLLLIPILLPLLINNPTPLAAYIQVQALTQLLLAGWWHNLHGSFEEPSVLVSGGRSLQEVMGMGIVEALMGLGSEL